MRYDQIDGSDQRLKRCFLSFQHERNTHNLNLTGEKGRIKYFPGKKPRQPAEYSDKIFTTVSKALTPPENEGEASKINNGRQRNKSGSCL